jgi:hypothetical protein
MSQVPPTRTESSVDLWITEQSRSLRYKLKKRKITSLFEREKPLNWANTPKEAPRIPTSGTSSRRCLLSTGRCPETYHRLPTRQICSCSKLTAATHKTVLLTEQVGSIHYGPWSICPSQKQPAHTVGHTFYAAGVDTAQAKIIDDSIKASCHHPLASYRQSGCPSGSLQFRGRSIETSSSTPGPLGRLKQTVSAPVLGQRCFRSSNPSESRA